MSVIAMIPEPSGDLILAMWEIGIWLSGFAAGISFAMIIFRDRIFKREINEIKKKGYEQ